MKDGFTKMLVYKRVPPPKKNVNISFKRRSELKEPEFEKCLKNSTRLSKVRDVSRSQCVYKIDEDQIKKWEREESCSFLGSPIYYAIT